jgi:CRISPR-associated protein Csb2
MHHSHAVLIFDEDVAGPLLIGAGRFRGYGLCRPLVQGGQDE